MINEETCYACTGGNTQDRIQKDIDRYGISVIGTTEDVNGKTIPMTYSVGANETLDLPEVILFGIPTEHAHVFINRYYRGLKEGTIYEPGKDYSEFAEGFPTRFKNITSDQFKDHLCQALYYNENQGNVSKAVQFLFPDADGNWADEEITSDDFKTMLNDLSGESL